MVHSIIITAITVLLGLYLLVASAKITAATKNYAVDSDVARSNQGLFTIAIIFIVAGISFGVCNKGCDCSEMASGDMYIYFFLLLGIVLVGLAGSIINGLNSSSDGKSWAITTLVMGIVFIVVCLSIIGYGHKDKFHQLIPAKYRAQPSTVQYGTPVMSGESMAFKFF